ncbi:hypothetical protein COT99_04210 [Candidatus Falkowbacteria bacterium CG10_big_fil_rev_8_21_14_0_10_43_10]|uniref:Uncharacterized protein n=1 Tax=Candidatus Falkowbacteria bacterium CG10_big_fil_rev_8_21_14_0_10_43_10 TaxID=1974567 RepID=A0A2H0V135_9BACT|nr:MAG: hypothetical protein COT99_04210 [Candidatus Falkowbacteria bacterium CG10_big_fil_rev_8_21_14_0_10_43_10]
MITERSVSEVRARCNPILGRPDLIDKINRCTPSAATIVIKTETGDEGLAKAGRWLRILYRDYPGEYKTLMAENQSSRTITVRQE